MSLFEHERNLLYFGAVPIQLSHVDGDSYGFNFQNTFRLDTSEEGKIISRSRLMNVHDKANDENKSTTTTTGCLTPIDEKEREEMEKLILPAIAASDLVLKGQKEKFTEVKSILSKPLLKVKNGEISGFASGIRSAIVKDNNNGKWYRLKGCGNNYDKFPFRDVENQGGGMKHEIRGCTFIHTASRELYFTALINSILKKRNIPIANDPVCWFEYDLPNTPVPSVKRCCTVFQTAGEKRLGDHLMRGLELLLPYVVKDFDYDKILSKIPAERWVVEDDNNRHILETGFAILEQEKFGKSLLDISDVKINEIAPHEIPEFVPDTMKELWKQVCLELQSNLDKLYQFTFGNSLLLQLFQQVGREAGEVQKLLTDNNISWGTYTDDLGFHSNSHPNNLVVLPPSPLNNGRLLAPLDFDMAFSKDTFDREEKDWIDWMSLEPNAMKLALAGCNINTGVQQVADIEDKRIDLLRWALRDNTVKAFEESLNCDGTRVNSNNHEETVCKIDEIMSQAKRGLLELALIATCQVVA